MVSKIKKCSFEGCEREVRSMNLCSGHNQQRWQGRELTPLKAIKRLHKDEIGRVCTTCGLYKPWSEYYGERRTKCKPCFIAKVRESQVG